MTASTLWIFDSEFPKGLDSSFFFFSVGLQIPIVSGIPDSKAQDSGFQKRKIRVFWDPDSHIWGENAHESQKWT